MGRINVGVGVGCEPANSKSIQAPDERLQMTFDSSSVASKAC